MPFIVPLYPQMARSQNLLILPAVKFYCLQYNLVKKNLKKNLQKEKNKSWVPLEGL